MFLRKLILDNVRCLDHLELPLTDEDGKPRRWTLLLGQNGAGKTSVLRAMALLLCGSDALPRLLADSDGWIRTGKKTCTIAAELQTVTGHTRNVSLAFDRGQPLKDVFRENRKTLDDLDAALSHSERNYLVLGYGATRRLSTDPDEAFTQMSSNDSSVRASAVATLFRADALLRPLQNWIIDLDYRGGKKVMGTIRSALARLLPGLEFKRIDKRRKQIIFKTPDGDVPLLRLSEGYQNMAAWCGDLLYNITTIFRDYRKPLEARGLLLIDELDLHLHPLWQRNLRTFLDATLPNMQIIATSHSPLTAQQCGRSELYALIRPSDRKPPALQAYAGDPRLAMIHQLLLDPIFELSTVDSKPVETLRKTYRNLKSKAKKNKAETKELAYVKAKLIDLPDWTGGSPADAEHRVVLQQIQQALSGDKSMRKGVAAKRTLAKSASRAPRSLNEEMRRATKK